MIKDKILTANLGDASISLINVNHPYHVDTIYFKDLILENGESTLTDLEGKIGPTDIIKGRGDEILVLNSYDESLITIDLKKKIITSILRLGRCPVCMKNINNKIYILNCDSNSFSIIDENNNTILEQINLDEKPSDLQVDYKENKIYISNFNGNSISIYNINDNSIETIKLNTQPVRIIVEDSKVFILSYINNGVTNYSCISTLDKVTKTITSHNIIGIYLDFLKLDDHNFLLTNPEDGNLYNYNNWDGKITLKEKLGGMPCKMVWDKEKTIYITDLFYNQVIVYDLINEGIARKIKVGEDPQGIYLL